MLLSNRAIHAALDAGRIRIEPEPSPRLPTVEHPETPYDATAVNLTLSDELKIPKEGKPFSYDLRLGAIKLFLNENYDEVRITQKGGFNLQPGQFALGRTTERVSLPIQAAGVVSLAARVEGKSSFARCGLIIHFTAPTIHAGYAGTITLEMINLGQNPITLYPGIPICQLLVEEVLDQPYPYESMFQNQNTAAGVKKE